MSIDIHSLMSCIDMNKLLNKNNSKNIQVKDMVQALISSEPCLFNNSSDNLMKTTEKEQQ